MGLFDYVVCKYPLPNSPSGVIQNADFQTKDLDCTMNRFVLTADGVLTNDEGHLVTVTVDLNIYCSNVVASGPGTYTANGEDEEWAEYNIHLFDGRVQSIDTVSTGRRPALKAADHRDHRTEAEISEQGAIEQRAQDYISSPDLIGKPICLWWGGQETGELKEVLFRRNGEFIVAGEFGLETLKQFQAGSTVFASLDDGKRWNEIQRNAWARGKAQYEALQRVSGDA